MLGMKENAFDYYVTLCVYDSGKKNQIDSR